MKVDNFTEKTVREMMQKIVDKLDELDEEDYFGTEGWRHFFEV